MTGFHHCARLRSTVLMLGALLVCSAGAEAQEFRPLADLALQSEEEPTIEPLPGLVPDDPQPAPEEPVSDIEALRGELARQQEVIDQLTQRANARDEQFSALQQDTDLTSRVAQIENTLLNARQDQQKSFLESLSTDALRRVNGRIHVDGWSFPESSEGINVIENGAPNLDPENRLLYRRIRFGVNGQVPPLNMSYRAEIEFSGQDGSTFRDCWIGWDELVFFNTVRVGNQKRPYGWDHYNSSNFMVFLERPFVVEGFNQDSRRFGLASYGNSPDESFHWQYGVFNLVEMQSSGSIVNDVFQGELAWRLGNTWWYDESSDGRGYGHWGVAGTFAFPDGDGPTAGGQANQARFQTRPEGRSTNAWLDTDVIAGANAYEILGLETVFNVGPLQVAGELMNLWLQRSDGYGGDLHLHGGYFYVSWFLTGEHIPWNRQLGILGRTVPFEDFFHVEDCLRRRALGIGAWQVAIRVSYADFNNEDVLGGIGEGVTLALNWYWNAHARLQFNYIFGRIDDRQVGMTSGGSSLESGDYQIAGVRFMIDF